jgi:hypothetical protein
LTEQQEADLVTIANQCSGFAGPGVDIARAAIGYAISDGQNCGAAADEAELILRPESLEAITDGVYPNPIKVGGMLTLPAEVDGELTFYNSTGSPMLSLQLENEKTIIIPKLLTPGLYFLKNHDSDAIFKVQIK